MTGRSAKDVIADCLRSETGMPHGMARLADEVLAWLGHSGYAIVPVSPVRADREAVVEAAQAILEESIPIIGEDAAHVPNVALTALESALAALRATPEPERAE